MIQIIITKMIIFNKIDSSELYKLETLNIEGNDKYDQLVTRMIHSIISCYVQCMHLPLAGNTSRIYGWNVSDTNFAPIIIFPPFVVAYSDSFLTLT